MQPLNITDEELAIICLVMNKIKENGNGDSFSTEEFAIALLDEDMKFERVVELIDNFSSFIETRIETGSAYIDDDYIVRSVKKQ